MQDPQASTLTYAASLPLSWESAPAPNQATLELWRHGNLALLHALSVLESAVSGDAERESDAGVGKALERIEAKVDVALSMLASLLRQQNRLPEACQVVLGAQGIEWMAADGNRPPGGSCVLLKLYLSPRLPEPLQLWVRLGGLSQADEQGLCRAEFLDQDADFEEWMTRTLFRYHRRALQARHQP